MIAFLPIIGGIGYDRFPIDSGARTPNPSSDHLPSIHAKSTLPPEKERNRRRLIAHNLSIPLEKAGFLRYSLPPYAPKSYDI